MVKSMGAIPVTLVTLAAGGLSNAFSLSSRPPRAGTASTAGTSSTCVTQRARLNYGYASVSKHQHGPVDEPARLLPLQLFGLGGGGKSSTSGSSTGAASKARKAIESNAVFRSQMAKVRIIPTVHTDHFEV